MFAQSGGKTLRVRIRLVPMNPCAHGGGVHRRRFFPVSGMNPRLRGAVSRVPGAQASRITAGPDESASARSGVARAGAFAARSG